jgi:hypothetical protein
MVASNLGPRIQEIQIMPAVEYMLEKVEGGGHKIPSFIKDGGHHPHPVKRTYVGWVDPKPRSYYVPNTIKVFDEESFMDRIEEIHLIQPFERDHPESVWDEEAQSVVVKSMEMNVQEAREWGREWLWRYLTTMGEPPRGEEGEIENG